MSPDTTLNPSETEAPPGLSRDALLSFEDDLPAMPATIGKLLMAIDNPDSGMDEITVLVSGDASLSTQLLRVANSAMFSQGGDARDIGQAVGAIGLGHLKTILFTRAVSQLQLADTGPALALVRDNSTATGVAMMIIAERLRRSDADQLFLYAVLHRLGQFVFLSHPLTKDRYPEVLSLIRNQQMSYHEAETQVLGVSHSWIGGMLARRWNFPLDFVHVCFTTRKKETATTGAWISVADSSNWPIILAWSQGTERLKATQATQRRSSRPPMPVTSS